MRLSTKIILLTAALIILCIGIIKPAIDYVQLSPYEKQYTSYIKSINKSLKSSKIKIFYDTDIKNSSCNNDCRIKCNVWFPNTGNSNLITEMITAFNDNINSKKYDLINKGEEKIKLIIYGADPRYSYGMGSNVCEIILKFNSKSAEYIPFEIYTSLDTDILNLTFKDVVYSAGFENVEHAEISYGGDFGSFEKDIMPYISELKGLKSLKFKNARVNLSCIAKLDNLTALELCGSSFINSYVIKELPNLKTVNIDVHNLNEAEVEEINNLKSECHDKKIYLSLR